MTLEVRRPGPLTTIQDAGRPALGHLGVPPGGAADPRSLVIANLLVGNEPDAAAVEITLGDFDAAVVEPTLVGLAGADLEARVLPLGRRLLPGASHRLTAGDRLVIPGADRAVGVRAYLSLPGGVDVPEVIGSRSTCLVGRFGGIDGRPAEAGDILRPARSDVGPPPRLWPPDDTRALARRLTGRVAVRLLPGPGLPTTSPSALAALVDRPWIVGADSNRMGVRLHGTPVEVAASTEVLSHGVTWGAVQLPPDGQPIILLADHQPTGGYPVIGAVIAADLPVLGQLGPGVEVRFEVVDLPAAREALRRERARFGRAEAEFRRSRPVSEADGSERPAARLQHER